MPKTTQKGLEQKFCIKCGVLLSDSNTLKDYLIHYQYICKLCSNKIQYSKRKPDYQKRQSEYQRRTRLSTTDKTGKRLIIRGLNKRKKPEDNECELCHKKVKMLSYHHWDDNKPSIGIWICGICHWIVESYENPKSEYIEEKYVRMKELIENGV